MDGKGRLYEYFSVKLRSLFPLFLLNKNRSIARIAIDRYKSRCYLKISVTAY